MSTQVGGSAYRTVSSILSAVVILLLWSQAVFASSTPLLGPVNSDPLTQRGISPRILDVAIVPMSQGLRYEARVVYQQTLEDGSSGSERFRMIFDPDTEYGRDLYIELESEPLRSARAYRRMLEVTMGADHWLRAEDRIHSASSIRLLSSQDGVDVIGFHYSSLRIPSSMNWLAQLSGKVYVIDGVLDRLELEAEGSFERDGLRHENYRGTVFFGEVHEFGGHVITVSREEFTVRLNRRPVQVVAWTRMLQYSSSELGDIAWVDTNPEELARYETQRPLEVAPAVAELQEDVLSELPVLGALLDEELHTEDTIRLSLQRTLPFWADEARKRGFELPRTYGLGFAAHYQKADIDMQGFKVGGIDITEDLPLIDPLGSDVDSDVLTGQFRGDFWLLPFLNVSLLLGEVETDSEVTLRFTPAFQALVGLKGGGSLPEFYNFDTSTSGTTAGLGLTTGFQYEHLISTLSVNYLETITEDTSSEIEAIVWMAMVGYDFGSIGLQALAGVQYLDTDRSIEGSIDLDDGERLTFEIDIGLEETTFMLGFNKDIGRNWNFSSFVGANGTKSSVTANFGYRW